MPQAELWGKTRKEDNTKRTADFAKLGQQNLENIFEKIIDERVSYITWNEDEFIAIYARS
jgi:hypothetical protein